MRVRVRVWEVRGCRVRVSVWQVRRCSEDTGECLGGERV